MGRSKRNATEQALLNEWLKQTNNSTNLDGRVNPITEDTQLNPEAVSEGGKSKDFGQTIQYGNELASNINIEDYKESIPMGQDVPVGLGEERLNEFRANNQSGAAQLLVRAPLRFFPSTLMKLGASIGYAYGAAKAIATQDPNDIFDNYIADTFEKADQAIKDKFLPIYTSQKYNEGSMLQKMGTTSFWSTDIFDGIAYMASAVLGAKGVGALAEGLGAVGGSVRAAAELAGENAIKDAIAKGATEAMLPSIKEAAIKQALTQGSYANIGSTLPKFAQNILGEGIEGTSKEVLAGVGQKTVQGTNAVVQSIMEAGSEADQTAKDVEKKLREQGITDEDYIKQVRGKAGLNTFLSNCVVLMPSSFIEQQWFLGDPLKNQKGIVNNIVRGVTKPEEISLLKEGLKEAGTGMVMEGLWEEGIQNAIQNHFQDVATGKSDKNFLEGISDEWFKGFTTKEGQMSMLAGAIIGAGGGFFGGWKEGKELRHLQKEGLEKKAAYEGEKPGYAEEFKNNVNLTRLNAAKNGLPDYASFNTINDEGEEKAFTDLTSRLLNDSKNLTQSSYGTITGDLTKANFVNNQAVGQYLWQHLTNPTYKDKESAIQGAKDGLDKLAGEEPGEGASEKDKQDYKDTLENLDKYKETIDEVSHAYSEFEKSGFKAMDLSKLTTESMNDNIGRDAIASKLYYMESLKQNSFAKMLQDINPDNEKAKEEINSLIKESKEYQEKLLDPKTRAKEFEGYAMNSEGTFVKNKISELEKAIKNTTNEKEKNKLNFELEEEKAINGELVPINKYGSLNTLKTLKKGLRQEEHFNLGEDYLIDKTLEKGVNSIDEKINLLSNKKNVTENDVNSVSKDIQNEENKLSSEWNNSISNLTSIEKPESTSNKYRDEDDEGNPTFDKATYNNDLAEYNNAQQLVTDWEAKRSKLDLLKNSLDTLETKHKAIKSNPINSLNIEDKLKMKHLANVYDSIDTIKNNYEGKPDEFTNKDGVNKAIKALEGIKEVYSNRENLKDFKWRGEALLDTINNDIELLQKALKQVEINLADRAKFDLQSQEKVNELNATKLGLGVNGEVIEGFEELNDKVNELVGEIILTKETGLEGINLPEGVNMSITENDYGNKVYNLWIGDTFDKKKNSVRVVENKEPNQYAIHEGDLKDLSKEDRIKLFKAQDVIIPQEGKIVGWGKSSFDGIRHRLNLVNHGWKIVRNIKEHTQGYKETDYTKIKEFADRYDLGDVLQNNTDKDLPGGVKHGDYYTVGVQLERISKKEVNTKPSNKEKVQVTIEKLRNLSKEEKKQLVNTINTLQNVDEYSLKLEYDKLGTLEKKILDIVVSAYKTTHQPNISSNQYLSKYLFNPNRCLTLLFSNLKENGLTDLNEEAFNSYIDSKDIVALTKFLESGVPLSSNISNTKLLELIDLHYKLIALKDLKVDLHSEYSEVKQIEEEIKFAKDKTILPTYQQTNLLRSVNKFILDKNKITKQYANIGYIRGIAGTGKTMLLKWVKATLKLKDSEVFVTGNNQSATDTANSSISSSNKEKTPIKDANGKITLDESKLVGVKLLVIDEIGALNASQLNELSKKIASINENRLKEGKDLLKTIVLGDPSQITPSSKGINTVAPLELNTQLNENITEFNPLTIAYRSNITAINDVIGIYLNNNKQVKDIYVSANVNLGEKNPLGVHVGTDQDFKTAFNSNKDRVVATINGKTSTESKSSKLIIVLDKNEIEKYKKLYPDAEVITAGDNEKIVTYIDAQGLTRDEVYIDLPNDKSVFPNDKLYNKAMYTALSRARNYIFLKNITDNFKQNINTDINEGRSTLEKQLEDNVTNYKERLVKEKEAFSISDTTSTEEKVTTSNEVIEDKLNTIEGVSTDLENGAVTLFENNISENDDINKDVTTEDKDDSIEVEAINKDVNIPTINFDRVDKGIKTGSVAYHELQYPIKAAISGKSNSGINPVKVGSEVLYVTKQDNNNKEYVAVLTPTMTVNGVEKDSYEEIGKVLIGTPEHKYLIDNGHITESNAINNTTSKSLKKDKTGNIIGVVGQGTLISTTPLNYKYDRDSVKTGEGTIENTLKAFNGFMVSPTVDKTKFGVSAVIYNHKTVDNSVLTNRPGESHKYNVGIPYLIIDTISSIGDAIKTQWIRLNPRKLNNEDINKGFLVPLKEFYESAKKISGIVQLGDISFYKVLSLYKSNFEVDNTNPKDLEVKFKQDNVTLDKVNEVLSAEGLSIISEEAFKMLTNEMNNYLVQGYYGATIADSKFTQEEFDTKFSDTELYKKDGSSYYNNETYYSLVGGKVIQYHMENGKPNKKIGNNIKEVTFKGGYGTASHALNILAQANKFVDGVKIRVTQAYDGKTVVRAKSLVQTKSSTEDYYEFINDLVSEFANEKKDNSITETYTDLVRSKASVEEIDNFVITNNIVSQEELNKLKTTEFTQPINLDTIANIVDSNSYQSGEHVGQKSGYYLRLPLDLEKFNKLGANLYSNGKPNKAAISEINKLISCNLKEIVPTTIVTKFEGKTINSNLPKNLIFIGNFNSFNNEDVREGDYLNGNKVVEVNTIKESFNRGGQIGTIVVQDNSGKKIHHDARYISGELYRPKHNISAITKNSEPELKESFENEDVEVGDIINGNDVTEVNKITKGVREGEIGVIKLRTKNGTFSYDARKLRGVFQKSAANLNNKVQRTEEEINYFEKDVIEKERSKELKQASESVYNTGKYKGKSYNSWLEVEKEINNRYDKYISDLSKTTSKVEPISKVEEVKETTKPEVKDIFEENEVTATPLLDEEDDDYTKMLSKESTSFLGKAKTINNIKKLASKWIPASNVEAMQYLLDLVKSGITDKPSYGAVSKGVIYLETDGTTVRENILRHEVFHKIFGDFLNPKEQKKLLKAFKLEFPQYANLNSLEELEEKIAEEFQVWRKGNKGYQYGIITKFFNWLSRFIGLTTKYTNDVNKFFTAIENGYFTKAVVDTNPSIVGTKNLVKIIEKFDNVQMFRNCKNYIQNSINKYTENGIKYSDGNTYALTSDEIIDRIKAEVTQRKDKALKERAKLQYELATEDNTDAVKEEKTNKILAIADKIALYSKIEANWNGLLKVIYPNREDFDTDEYKQDELFEEEIIRQYSEENNVSIKEHIQASEEHNSEKTSDSVKNYLANIPIYKPEMVRNEKGELVKEVESFVNPRVAFIKTLQMLATVQTWSNDFMLQVSNLKTFFKDKNTAAIVDALTNLYNKAKADVDEKGKKLSNVKFLDEDTFIFSINEKLDLKDFAGLTQVEQWNRVNKGTENEILIQTRFNKEGKKVDTPTFMKTLVKLSDKSLEGIKIKFDAAIAGNTVAEVYTHFKSQAESNPRYAEIVDNFGKLTISYKTAKQVEYSNGVKNNLLRLASDKWDTKKKISDYAKENRKEYFDLRDSGKFTEYINKFLKDLGYTKSNLEFPAINLGAIVTDINFFLNPTDDRFGEIGTERVTQLNEDEEEGSESYIITAEQVYADKAATMFNELADLLTYNSDNIRNTSSLNAEGKKVYRWHNTSQAMEILHLARYKYAKDSRVAKSKLPEYLQLPFFQLNPFNSDITSNQKIHNIIEHDGTRTLDHNGETKDVTTYTHEKFTDYFNRSFLAAFISNIGFGAGNTYIQFFHTISNKPKAIGAEINVLNPSQLKENIKLVLRQLEEKKVDSTLKEGVRNPKRIINFDTLYEGVWDVTKDKLAIGRDTDGTRLIDVNYLIEGLSSEKKEELYNTIADATFKRIEKYSKEVTQALIDEKFLFHENIVSEKLDNVIKEFSENYSLKDTFSKGYKTLETWKDVRDKYYKNKQVSELTEEDKAKHPRQYLLTNEQLEPLVLSWIANDMVNSYHLNQLVAGDMSYFKSAEDMVKRMSIVFAEGIRPFVNDLLGMKKTYKTLIGSDPNYSFKSAKEWLKTEIFEGKDDELAEKIAEDFPNKGYDIPDGQGFMLPERWEDLNKSLGKGYKLGDIMKPVYDGVDSKGINREKKYSSIKLSDELIYGTDANGKLNKTPRFTKLYNMRENMRKLGAGEFIFDSGVKQGSLDQLVNIEDLLSDNPGFETRNAGSVITLDNRNYRLQLNPIHDVDSNVANPTQLSYFLNVLFGNELQAGRVYNAFAKLINQGLDNFNKSIKTNGKFDNSKITDVLLKKLEGDGNERIHEILDTLSKEKGIKAGFNFPAIVDKCLIQLSSAIAKETVNLKFPGSKFVLQATPGIEIVDSKGVLRELKYYKKTTSTDEKISSTETIISRGLLDKETERLIDEINDHNKKLHEEGATTGYREIPDIFLYNDLLGFRIPSSEIHSAVPMKVVGFHSKGSNIVIMPHQIVLLQGSDYDVDSLFVIRRSALQDKEGNKYEPIGYTKGKDGLVFDHDLQEAVINLETTSKYLRSNGKLYNLDKLSKEEVEALLQKEYWKNQIVESFLEVITNSKNNERMYSNIQTKTIEDDLDQIAKLITNDNTATKAKLIKKWDLSKVLDRFQSFISSFDGAAGTGIVANGIKVLAYYLNSGSNKANTLTLNPKLYPDNTEIPPMIVDGEKVTSLVNNLDLWKDLDSFLNAAIDNVKLQILPMLNLNGTTLKTFIAMRGLGLTMQQANRFMVQPVIKELIKIKWGGATTLENQLKALHDDNNYKKIEVTTENLEKFLNSTKYDLAKTLKKDITKLTTDEKELINFQRKVLDYFNNFTEVGTAITDMSMYLGILKSPPVLQEDIERLLNIRDKMFTILPDGKLKSNPDYAFNIDNFFNVNPHIEAANKVLDNLASTSTAILYKHNKFITDFVKDAFSGYDIKLDKKEEKSEVLKRNEFVKYLASGLDWEGNQLNNEENNTYSYKDGKGVTQLLTGKKAFVQNFIDKIETLQNTEEFKKNKFINGISIKTNPKSGLRYITFNLGVNLTPADTQDLEDNFNALKGIIFSKDTNWNFSTKEVLPNEDFSNFQKEFVNYAILTTGLNFGVTNYTTILPPSIYIPFYKAFEGKLLNLINNKVELSKLKDNFRVELAVNYADKLPRIQEYPIPAQRYQDQQGEWVTILAGVDNGIVYDIKHKGTGLKDFIKREDEGKISVYYKVAENEESKLSYYQKVSNKNYNVSYNLNENIIDKGYSLQEAFRPDYKNIQIDSFNKLTIKNAPKDTLFSVTEYSDYARTNKKWFTKDKSGKLEEFTGEVMPYSKEVEVYNPPIIEPKKVELEVYKKYYNRGEVIKQIDKVFLFGDNTNDRVNTHYIPSSTQAVIRGLPNAIGIDTKKNRGVDSNSYFSDSDLPQFKKQVDEAIKKAKDSGKIIVVPADGIGTGKAMLKEKAPKLFEYLQEALKNIVNTPTTIEPMSDKQAEVINEKTAEQSVLEQLAKCAGKK